VGKLINTLGWKHGVRNINTIKKLLFLIILALGPCLASAEETWLVFQPPGPISFSISMPGHPEKQGGQDEWRARDHSGREYSGARGYYTEPTRIKDPEAFMRMMVERLAAASQSKLAYFWPLKYQDVPACEFKLVDLKRHQVAVGRYFLVNQWFYFIDYTTSDKAFDFKSMKKFFDSFKMINPELKDFQPESESGL
jgi:hypothetical protein